MKALFEAPTLCNSPFSLQNNNNYSKKISHAIIGYISGLEHIGKCDENSDYIDRAKDVLEENVEANRIEEFDLIQFLMNVDFSRWNRQDLEKYESFLRYELYQELMEMWEEAQEKEAKNLINAVIQEAKQQKIPLEELTKEFLKAVVSEGINSDDLYECILKSEAFKLVEEQRNVLKQKEREAFKELEDKKRNLYNPDNLFKKENVNEVEKYIKITSITLLNEKWYQKIIRVIKNIFKRK